MDMFLHVNFLFERRTLCGVLKHLYLHSYFCWIYAIFCWMCHLETDHLFLDASFQETAAAIKVQSVFRRKKVMDELEAEGLETTAMRNRRRRRGARKNRSTNEDSPGLFQCCGLGLMFGDASEEDEKAQREFEKAQYEEKKRQQDEREAAPENLPTTCEGLHPHPGEHRDR